MKSLLVTLTLSLGVAFFAQAQNPQESEEYVRNYVDTLMKEAEQGKTEAQSFLGIMYEKGIGVAKDETAAVEWYRKAAEQGKGDAQSILGLLYADGRGIAKNEVKAMKWFRKAVQSELREFSQQPIHFHFAGGYQGALKAAEGGDPFAQTIVGKMYLTGSGVAQNDVEAVRWLTEGAKESGTAGAQEALAFLYEEGRGGLPRDKAEAMHLYRRAAEQWAADLEASVRMVYQFGAM